MTSHFPVQTLSQASSNYQNPRYLEQGLPLASWTDVDPCNWVPRPLGPALLCKLGFPDSSIGKESACNAGDSDSWVRKIHWRRDRLHTPVFLGFPCGSAGKESACNVEMPSSLVFCLGGHRVLKPMHPTKFLGCNSWTLQEEGDDRG